MNLLLALLANADIDSGQKISKKCVACHGFDAGGPNKVGPNLYNIVNKDQGKADYAYSKNTCVIIWEMDLRRAEQIFV